MEDNQQNSLFELDLNDEGKANLSSIAQWGYINAVVGFISAGLTLVSAFASGARNSETGGNILTVFVSISISLLLNITLVNAAVNLKKGVNDSDQGYFNLGMLKLASYFKILGILLIIVLVIVFLAMLILLLASPGATSGIK